MKKVSLVCMTIFSLMLFATFAVAEESFWDKTKDGATDAVDWTKEKSEKGLEAAKEGTEKAVDWTKEKSKEVKESLKESLDD